MTSEQAKAINRILYVLTEHGIHDPAGAPNPLLKDAMHAWVAAGRPRLEAEHPEPVPSREACEAAAHFIEDELEGCGSEWSQQVLSVVPYLRSLHGEAKSDKPPCPKCNDTGRVRCPGFYKGANGCGGPSWSCPTGFQEHNGEACTIPCDCGAGGKP